MLKLGLDLSLSSIKTLGAWSPDDETYLVAWYKNATGITLNGSDVSKWNDSSSNSYDMVQATASEQPAYNDGDIDFVAADTQNLQTTGQIGLLGVFTIGIRLNPDSVNVVVLGDNTSGGEFLKIQSSSVFKVKIGGTEVELSLNSGSFGDDYLVITRNASNLITLYRNGTVQTDTETLSGTSLIDTIGVRRTDLNAYDGTISEIQIYAAESSSLTANVNDYLSQL